MGFFLQKSLNYGIMVYGWERSKKMNANVIFTTNMISANLNMLARARKQRRQLLEMGYGIEVPKIMEKKFEEAWKRQEEELAKVPSHIEHQWSFDKYDPLSLGGWIKKFNNGENAEMVEYNRQGEIKSILRYDADGNIIQNNYTRYVYYKGTNVKEFEWTQSGGIKHFDKNGKENTDKYYKIHQIASKRVKAEKKGEVFKKMSKVEKAVAMMNVNKDELTAVERMLIGKKKNER